VQLASFYYAPSPAAQRPGVFTIVARLVDLKFTPAMSR